MALQIRKSERSRLEDCPQEERDMADEDYIPYFMRGLQDIPTTSSRLVSSSKFLNHPTIREYVMQESLRRNGREDRKSVV